MDHKFQVNLNGIIDLLSNHLYSSPEVYLRELLQNGVDAIQARMNLDPEHQGEIHIEVVQPADAPPTLIFQDNGVGLTTEEVHQFLATIGESSKRDAVRERREDFIGQFGIGLLSCFLVSDEIVVISRSARGHSLTVEWRGRPDGTYSIKEVEREVSPGTQIYLQGKPESEEHLQPERVRELLEHFGAFLPMPLYFTQDGETVRINPEGPPWSWEFGSASEQRERLLTWGRNTLGGDFFDAIRLRSLAGDIEGVAFVLPYAPSPAAKGQHRVYLKNMLLSENAEHLLPEWAFFVKCVINANDLRPTASRESFYEDQAFFEARESLGECLKGYLLRLAQADPRRLEDFIRLHYLSIKLLATHDDEFYRLFIDWLPFETTNGPLRMSDIRDLGKKIYYTQNVQQFSEISTVAKSQGLIVINGGYVYDASLVERLPGVYPEIEVEKIDAAHLVESFEDLSDQELEPLQAFLHTADEILRPFKCQAAVRKFFPEDIPTLYGTNEEIQFRRSVDQSKEVADPLWGGLLDSIQPQSSYGLPQLCFNYRNPLIRRVLTITDEELLRRTIQMLYVQALLLGHHPLSSEEMALLNEGLLGFIQWGIDARQ